ncbi:MAG: hypothetical protein J5695_01995 [Bacteroidales bacterium]|nr:hypothetical protein [Bacteroidales bacterium]
MNGKRNRFILKGMLLLSVALPAQLLHSQDIYDWEAWRGGRNIAGLASSSSPRGEIISPVKRSGAEFTGGMETGGYRSGSEAPTLWTGGVKADTEVHYKDLLLTGDFSFAVSGGDGMCGSMFTEPGLYPIDILEFTPGAKTLQNYGIGGGIAWKNGSRFIPGCTLQFVGANYSKRKDLRHTTYRQELDIVPSPIYDGDGLVLGVSGIFGKDSEFVQAEQIGSATAESYYAFLDKGLMYGTYQVWDGNGVHLTENGVDRLPVKQYSYGAALQAEIGSFLYAEAEYLRTAGEVGEKGYTWFRFPGSTVDARLQWTLHRPAGVHVVAARFEWMRQETDESVIDRVSSGGVTTPVEYGSNRIFERRHMTAGPEYGFYGAGGTELHANLSVTKEKDRSTLMYPFLDLDEVTLLRFGADGSLPYGAFVLDAGISGGCKIGEHRHYKGNDNESAGLVSAPYRLEEWFEREQELSDAPFMGASVSLRYNFTIAGKYNLYAEAMYSIVHAFGIELLDGSERHTAQIKLGYDF